MTPEDLEVLRADADRHDFAYLTVSNPHTARWHLERRDALRAIIRRETEGGWDG